jgi:carbon storage regulator
MRQEEHFMLVLSRKVGEGIVIADTVVVTVLQANKKTIRLGIKAPSDIRVLRDEVQVRVNPPAPPSPEVAVKS